MQFLEKLDLAILDGFFQKIADWVNDRWGKSCFWLAKLCSWLFLVVATIGQLWAYIYGSAVFGDDQKWMSLAVLAVLGFGQLYRIREMEKLDQNEWSLRELRAYNPQRQFIPWGFSRIFFLFVMGSALIVVLIIIPAKTLYDGWELFHMVGTIAAALSFTGSFYFVACTPKPPSPLRAGNKLAAQASTA